MPRFPDISRPAHAVPASIFARLVERVQRYQGEIFPFHLGDTHLEPPAAARLEALAWDAAAAGRLYCYSAPAGDPVLLEAIVAKVRAQNRLDVSSANIQVTAGATHAFSCAARALLDRGDEVLLLSPYWPLIRGHVLSVGARPVEVPFSAKLIANPALDAAALIEPYVTPRTAAIYLITPNNPDGKVLGRRELESIAEIARRHDLWVLADEVYEAYAFDAKEHLSIATLAGMAERTVTVFSFSKTYAQAGLRVGYAVAPAPVTVAIRKLANHSIYSVPRAMQRAALAALEHGGPFLIEAHAEYRAARDETVKRLPIPCAVPEGGSYVFLDLSRFTGPDRQALPVLERLAEHGVLLAPGDAFGKGFGAWARLCYTAVPRSRLAAGLDRMSTVLGVG